MAQLIENINKVKEFHEVFRISYQTSPTAEIHENEFMLRYNLMKEENDEYLDACRNGDLTEIADALGDKMYILFGTIIKHGLQHKIEEIFAEIHRSNMSKLDENNQPIYREDGKILKSTRYFRPDIKSVLEK
jgi:predicted HAD superfamily Cof-like phosphohydrolase